MRIYLLINAIMYIGFALWCALVPHGTAQSVGFSLPSNKGLAEYVAVYGGLQFAMGLFFALGYWRADLLYPAMIFAACLYVCLALFRTVAMVAYKAPTAELGWVFYSMEILFAIIALWLLWRGDATPS
jgi:hypothetical protein